MTSPVPDWNPAADTDGAAVAHPKHEPSPLLADTTVVAPPLVVSVMEKKADVRDTAMVSGVDWQTTAFITELEPNDHTPVAVAVAVAVATHVLGYVSEKPALHAVQMPSVAPAVQVAQLLEQNAHVPANAVDR